MSPEFAKERLEYLRGELRGECISQMELMELTSLIPFIEAGDVELLEPAGVPESPDGYDFTLSVDGIAILTPQTDAGIEWAEARIDGADGDAPIHGEQSYIKDICLAILQDGLTLYSGGYCYEQDGEILVAPGNG